MILIDDLAKEFAKEISKKSVGYIENSLKEKKEDIEHFFSDKFKKYFETRANYLNTSTSQLFRNKDYKISDLYEPLTIKNKAKNRSYLINKFPEELTRQAKKIILVDNAGMGKSTILKMMFIYSIMQKRSIPFYIDLKSMIKDGTILKIEEVMISEFPSFKNVPTIDFIQNQLDKNKFTFLLDGADEVPDSMKQKVFDNVISFQKKCTNGEFIIASRNEDIILSSFNDYQIHDIHELRRSQAYNILRNYKFKDVDAEELINEIEKKENEPVIEFLKNPLLTTLLYTSYSFKRTIPLKKSHFFKQIYQSLYENHDATKIGYLTREKKSGLDIDSFERIISHIAFISRIKEKLNYKEHELIETINEIKTKHPTLTFDTRSFIQDVISRVPVIKKDGLEYLWQHKSIQEYFFVIFITKIIPNQDREDFVCKLARSDNPKRFKLAFDILFDEDEDLFHRSLTSEVCKHYNNGDTKVTDDLYKYVTISSLAPPNTKQIEQFKSKIREKSGQKIDHNTYAMTHIFFFEKECFIEFESKHLTAIQILFEKKMNFVKIKTLSIEEINNSEHFYTFTDAESEETDLKMPEIFRKEFKQYVVDVGAMNDFFDTFNSARRQITDSLNLLDIKI